uniref:Reverse transcriptase zinc-binding domain-containing protein n=1 Tax=Lepisosteus oculatus TaxID=7918 RepID=W5MP44_LEPOC
MTFSIATVNVRGLRERNKRVAVFKELARRRFDLCLLRKKSIPVYKHAEQWEAGWGERMGWSVGGVHSSGVGVLIGNRDVLVEGSVVVVPGRALSVDLSFGKCNFRVVRVCAPAVGSMRADFFKELFPLCATNRFLVIGGDFDVDLINKEERERRSGEDGDIDKKDGDARVVRDMLRMYNLIDCYKEANPQRGGYTWSNTRGVIKRLDYIFASSSVAVETVKVTPVWFSDHCMVNVRVARSGPEFGRGVWRLNCAVLEETAYLKMMEGLLVRCLNKGVGDRPRLEIWEETKEIIGRASRMYCRERRRRERKDLESLEKELELLGVERMGLKTSENQIAALLKQIRKHHERRAREFLFRARVEFLDHYETCSKYFFNRIRKRQEKRVFHSILATSGKQVTDQDGMLREAARFYEELFAEKVCEREAAEEVLQTLQATLTEEERDNLGKPFELSELEAAMKSLKKGKVPGVDGIPVEFYRTFWPILGPFLLEVMGEIFSKKSMGKSMREGILTLVFKKGDRTELKNWRPLTLLCVDYKIIAKLLVHRLSRVMTNVIGRDQTCGVKGRSVYDIFDNMVQLSATWKYYRHAKVWVAKYWDRQDATIFLSHKRLYQRLIETSKPPPEQKSFSWVCCVVFDFVNNVSSLVHLCVSVSVSLSPSPFPCSLCALSRVSTLWASSRAFSLQKTWLGTAAAGGRGLSNRSILVGGEFNIDMSDVRGSGRTWSITEVFAKASGAKLNRGKSQIKFFGRWRDRQDCVGGLQVCRDRLKILGIHFKEEDAANYNWLEKLEKARMRLGRWKHRGLTHVGKALIIKIEVLALLGYLASVYPMPLRLNRYLTSLFEYIGRVDMYRPIEEGRGGVQSLPIKLSCLFVSSLCVASKMPVEQAERGIWFGQWISKHTQGLEGKMLSNHRSLYETVMAEGKADLVGGLPKEVWSRIQPKGLQHDLMDLNWFIAWQRLPVREILHRHKLTLQPLCPREKCNKLESIRHVFWDCDYAGRMWAKCSLLFEMITLNFVITLNMVLYGLKKEAYSRETTWVLWVLMSYVKLELWKAQNGLVKNGVQL